MTLFDYNHLAHIIVLSQMQTFMTVTVQFCFYLEGRFNGGSILHIYEFGVLIFGA